LLNSFLSTYIGAEISISVISWNFLTVHIVPGYAWYDIRDPLFINSVCYNIKQTWYER
jgi:hypothetical protein